ncbi:hypothetical protein DXV76_06040 [Rhodobacteraceae bacterium CCMM004]|nr:hypothetical protein DXV76_06040 [Rhodobacteraceae bacterium CCMM004]
MRIVAIVVAAGLAGPLAAEVRTVDAETAPGIRQAGFLAVDLTSGRECRRAQSRLDDRHAPWSTFKIPNF